MLKAFRTLMLITFSFSGFHSAYASEILRTEQLPCFQEDKVFGRLPRPGCEAKARTPWSSEQTYRFDQDGFRNSERKKSRRDAFTILLLGQGLDGVGLKEKNLPAAHLKTKLNELGFERIEVISAVVPGFGAGRYAILSAKLAERFKPNLVLYFQSGDQFALDYFEAQYVEGSRYRSWERYVGGECEGLCKAWRIAKTFWSLYLTNYGEKRTEEFLKPTWSAWQEIAAQFGLEIPFLISWAPRAARSASLVQELPFGLNFLVQFLTPEIQVSGVALTNALNAQNYSKLLVARNFSQPVRFGLAPKQNPLALTPKGAEVWAESMAIALQSYIEEAHHIRRTAHNDAPKSSRSR